MTITEFKEKTNMHLKRTFKASIEDFPADEIKTLHKDVKQPDLAAYCLAKKFGLKR